MWVLKYERDGMDSGLEHVVCTHGMDVDSGEGMEICVICVSCLSSCGALDS